MDVVPAQAIERWIAPQSVSASAFTHASQQSGTTIATDATAALAVLQAPEVTLLHPEIDKDGGGTGGGTASSGTTYPIAPGSVIFITDRTTSDDLGNLTTAAPAGTPIFPAISNWQQVGAILAKLPPGSVTALNLSGHGLTSGGVNTSDGGLVISQIPPSVLIQINTALKPGAPIVLYACSQSSYPEGMQDGANTVNRPVVGNTGPVSGGNVGAGDWITWTLIF